MKTFNNILVLLTFLSFNSCKKDDIKIDPCSQMVKGYVIGFDQCSMGKGFVVTTIVPADTLETFNLPDSLYHFPTNLGADIYHNYISDFMFPSSYKNMFPINYSFEIVPESEKHYVICLDQLISHYAHAVKNQIKIKCVTK